MVAKVSQIEFMPKIFKFWSFTKSLRVNSTLVVVCNNQRRNKGGTVWGQQTEVEMLHNNYEMSTVSGCKNYDMQNVCCGFK